MVIAATENASTATMAIQAEVERPTRLPRGGPTRLPRGGPAADAEPVWSRTWGIVVVAATENASTATMAIQAEVERPTRLPRGGPTRLPRGGPAANAEPVWNRTWGTVVIAATENVKAATVAIEAEVEG